MDITLWLILTNALVWLGIGGYLAFVSSRLKRQAAEIRLLKMLRGAADAGDE